MNEEQIMDIVDRGGIGAVTEEERGHLGACGACSDQVAEAVMTMELLVTRRRRRRSVPGWSTIAAALVISAASAYALWTASKPADTAPAAAVQEVDPVETARLIDQLDGADLEARGKAEESLFKMGAAVQPLLKEAIAKAGPEGKARLQKILERIDLSLFGEVVYTCEVMGNDGGSTPHIALLAGLEQKVICPGQTPCWSPDGRKIAFVSFAEGNPEICVMNAGGDGLARLTRNRSRDLMPRWSPDGKKIAFTTDRDGNYEVYVMNSDGSDQTPVTSNAVADYGADWSPDGKSLVFVSARDGDDEIYVMKADGSDQQRLTRCPVFDTMPRWSPDGKRILFMSTRACGEEGGLSEEFDLYIMDANGRNPDRLTQTGAAVAPAWTANGRILYIDSEEGLTRFYTCLESGDQRAVHPGKGEPNEGGFVLMKQTGWRLQSLESWQGGASVARRR